MKTEQINTILDQIIKGLETQGLEWFRTWTEDNIDPNEIFGKNFKT